MNTHLVVMIHEFVCLVLVLPFFDPDFRSKDQAPIIHEMKYWLGKRLIRQSRLREFNDFLSVVISWREKACSRNNNHELGSRLVYE